MLNPFCGRLTHLLRHTVIVLSLIGLLQPVAPLLAQGTQKILVMNAYHRGFKWTDSITSGVESVLESGPDKLRRQVEYIYLDTKRVYTPEYLKKLYDIYRFKFRPGEFDVIIASDNNALTFLLENRDEIFGPTPVVFCGINNFKPQLIGDARHYTGVNELPDLKGNIELILKLHPQTQEIVIIEDDTPTGLRTHQQLVELVPQYQDRLQFRFVQKQTMANLQMTLGSLREGSIALYTTFFRDGNGQFFEYDESANLISAASAVPVYATWDFSLGFGVVGGKLTDGFSQGETAARMALQVLAGTPPEQIPVRMTSPSRYMFDAQQLKRFGIDEAALPNESLMINQPDQHYRTLFIRSSLTILVMALLLTVLLVINYRRKKAERAMRVSEERLQALLSNTVVGIGITDNQGRYLKVNDTWNRMLRLPSRTLPGQHTIHAETPKEDHSLRLESFEKLIQGITPTLRQERRFERSDGSHFWGDHTVVPIHDEQGEITASISMTVDITQRRRAEDEIRQLAYYDPLTTLPNRALFKDRMAQALRNAKRDDTLLGLLFLDLDRFKDVNDTLGHDCGDILLQQVAVRLGSCIRQSDTVARYGGDEFVILLPSLQSREDVAALAGTILKAMQQPFTISEQELYSTTSIGAAIFPYDGFSNEQLLKHADMAMYCAKTKGRNTCEFFSVEMHRLSSERVELENDMRRALNRDEFFLEYQPQYDLQSGQMVGVEALIRWHHPHHGIIQPDDFIPLAEETGIIRPIGEWVLRTACAQGVAWTQGGAAPIRIGVNLSAVQLTQPDLVDVIDEILRATGLPASRLELELTETTFMQNATETIETLTDLKMAGVRLAIDDFGTGYSSLNYLKNFPIDRIKIDRGFMQDLFKKSDNSVIVETILAMAHNLRLQIIAEGIETEEQLTYLKQRGCPDGQGHYLSLPLAPEAVFASSPFDTSTLAGNFQPVEIT